MLDIKLSDGKIIKFKNQVNGFQIAEKISKSLVKEACVISIDGEIKDLSFEIKKKMIDYTKKNLTTEKIASNMISDTIRYYE